MDHGTSETLGDVFDEIESLCKQVGASFNPYDLKGSLQRVIYKLNRNKELIRRALSAEEEW